MHEGTESTYAVISAGDSDLRRNELVRAGSYRRSAPVILGDAARPIIDGCAARFRRLSVRTPPVWRYELRDALLVEQGIVISPRHGALLESLADHAPEFAGDIVQRSRATLRVRPRGSVAALGGSFVSLKKRYETNYGHWLVELLPKAYLNEMSEGAHTARYIVPQTQNAALRNVYLESLGLLAIDASRVIPVGQDLTRVDQLDFVTPVSGHPRWKHQVLREMREALLNAVRRAPNGRQTSLPTRLFVDRPESGYRRIRNHREIQARLDAYGFTTIYPEDHSFVDQIRLFSRAEIIVGVLGAAMTNTLFAPEHVELLYLAPESICGVFFWDLQGIGDQRYRVLYGRNCADATSHRDDFRIDLAELSRALEAVVC
jgi:capsular polysaccharide biosynthesis protein